MLYFYSESASALLAKYERKYMESPPVTYSLMYKDKA